MCVWGGGGGFFLYYFIFNYDILTCILIVSNPGLSRSNSFSILRIIIFCFDSGSVDLSKAKLEVSFSNIYKYNSDK